MSNMRRRRNVEKDQDQSVFALSNRRRFLKQSMALGGAASMPWMAHAQESGKTLKVGVLLGLSGPGAPYGNDALSGIQTAVELLNKAGGIKSLGGARIQIEAADHQGKPDVAQTLVERLGPSVVAFVALGALAVVGYRLSLAARPRTSA